MKPNDKDLVEIVNLRKIQNRRQKQKQNKKLPDISINITRILLKQTV
jgi:hypothetical protein